jgi:hypothetical protein
MRSNLPWILEYEQKTNCPHCLVVSLLGVPGEILVNFISQKSPLCVCLTSHPFVSGLTSHLLVSSLRVAPTSPEMYPSSMYPRY